MALARIYAEILGLTAFTVVLLRAIGHGADLEAAAWSALAALVLWGIVGCLVGAIADRVVTEGVQAQLLSQLKQRAGSGDAATDVSPATSGT